jgi:hypothetical protein
MKFSYEQKCTKEFSQKFCACDTTGENSESGHAPYLLGDPCPKEPACAARVDSPLLNLGGVRPHEVAERALVRDLLITVQRPNLQGKAIHALVHTARRERHRKHRIVLVLLTPSKY